MPIQFNLEQLRKEHNCSIYFETGLYDPRLDVSIKHALACSFDKIYSIEIREDWVELGKDVFKDEIMSGKINLILDDSVNLGRYLNQNIFKENKTMFFLDAHIDNDNIHNYKKKCPLLEELEAIKCMDRKDHVILVDDLRYLRDPFPWDEDSYGNINFLEHITKKILEINANYTFYTLPGLYENDILLAHI